MVAANFSFIAEAITRLTKSNGEQDVSRVAQAQTFVFDCADGKMLAVQLSTRQKFWDALVKVVDDPLLSQSSLFETDELRVQNYDRLYEMLRPVFKRFPVDAWLDSLRGADIPSARVLSVREVAGAEENAGLKLLDEIVQPKFGSIYVPASPIQIEGTDKLPPTAPPTLGQQTREILSELGYSSTELTSMLSSGVVRA
jgi:formyl-CoA transferase